MANLTGRLGTLGSAPGAIVPGRGLTAVAAESFSASLTPGGGIYQGKTSAAAFSGVLRFAARVTVARRDGETKVTVGESLALAMSVTEAERTEIRVSEVAL